MTYESQAVDDFIRYSMGGISTTSRIMGDFSHRILNLIYFCTKNKNPSKGSQKVRSMVISEKDLKIIPLKDDDIETFCKSAARMDITYCVLKDYKFDGISNILIYASDSAKVSKIMKRYDMEKVDVYAKYPSREKNAVLSELPDTVAKEGDKSLNPTEERKTEKSQSEPTLAQYQEDAFRSLPIKERMEMLNRQAESTLSRMRERPTNLPKRSPSKAEKENEPVLPLSVAKSPEK